MNATRRDRFERPLPHDDQPNRPYPHTGGARPVAPIAQLISPFTVEPFTPDEEERVIGRQGIAAAREALKRAQPPQPKRVTDQ